MQARTCLSHSSSWNAALLRLLSGRCLSLSCTQFRQSEHLIDLCYILITRSLCSSALAYIYFEIRPAVRMWLLSSIFIVLLCTSSWLSQQEQTSTWYQIEKVRKRCLAHTASSQWTDEISLERWRVLIYDRDANIEITVKSADRG